MDELSLCNICTEEFDDDPSIRPSDGMTSHLPIQSARCSHTSSICYSCIMSIKMNKAVEENKDPCKIKWLGCPDCRKKTCFNTEDLIVDIGRCATLRLLRKKSDGSSNTSPNIEPSDGDGGESAASRQKRESKQSNIERETSTSVEEVVSIANRILSSMHSRSTSTQKRTYQDVTKTEEGRKRFKAAINTFRSMADADPNANLSEFAESQQISRSQLYPYCRTDEKRIDFVYKGKMPKAVKEKTSAKKRGSYKSYSEEEISSAISECHQRQKKDPDLSIQAFAEEKGISYSRLYPFCRRDEKREVYSPKGQQKKLTPEHVREFCYKVLHHNPSLDRQLIISSLQTDFGLDKTAANNQYNRVVKPAINSLKKNDIKAKIMSSNEQLVTIGGKRDSNNSTDTSSATAVQPPSNKVTKQQQKRLAPRKRGETERKEIQQAVSNWNSQYKDQINPSTGMIWTLTEFVESPGALGVKYGTLYDYCRGKKAKDVPSEQQNIKIPNRLLTPFIRSMAQHPNNSRSQVINSLRLEFQLGYRQACNQYENNVKEPLNSLLAFKPSTRRTTFDEVEYSSEYNVKQPLMSKVVSTQKKTERGPYIDWSLPENQARLYYLVTTFNNAQDNGNRAPSLSAYAKANHIAYKTIQPYCCKNVHERKKIEFKQRSLLDENQIQSFCEAIISEQLSLDDPPSILDRLQLQ